VAEVLRKPLNRNTILLVSRSDRNSSEHLHYAIFLIVRKCCLKVFEDVYEESLKIKLSRWECEGRELEAEEDAFFEYVDKFRNYEGGGDRIG